MSSLPTFMRRRFYNSLSLAFFLVAGLCYAHHEWKLAIALAIIGLLRWQGWGDLTEKRS